MILTSRRLLTLVLIVSCLAVPGAVRSAELEVLDANNWSRYVPHGKEVDCIYGDYVLRNDRIVAVIARPVDGRNANMTVRDVGGCIIDLTRREQPSDQLSEFYPLAGSVALRAPDGVWVEGTRGRTQVRSGRFEDARITVEISAPGGPGRPSVVQRYRLEDGDDFLQVETQLTNPHDQPLKISRVDALRADRTFQFGTDTESAAFWAYDEWFRQAYAVQATGYTAKREGAGRGIRVSYVDQAGSTTALEPGKSMTLKRRLMPAADLLAVRGLALRSAGKETAPVSLTVTDSAGPVDNAKVTVSRGDQAIGSGRTDPQGQLRFSASPGDYTAKIEGLGRPAVETNLRVQAEGNNRFQSTVQPAGYVVARITNQRGGPLPCKVSFEGIDGTESPFWGPDSGAVGVQNVYYSHDGRFRTELGPGKYRVIVSRGPEYDAETMEIQVQRGKETSITAQLKHVVDTSGWVSSDFHSHSSPSGDNTGSQFGRVLNLLCEHIEFAPCTEHNRIDTYVPHLKRLHAEHLMATCTGIELTGSPLPVNHQNAFPLLHQPRTQDGGGPVTDLNPIVQIERLAMWDQGSDKLVQGNHPMIPTIFGDRNNDGKPDGGFKQMLKSMDVIEVHPPDVILTEPGTDAMKQLRRKPIVHWMQLLNLGYRIPGVVNTDAHYNYHESGWLRNWIRSSTDNPAEIETMDMVHAAESGRMVISTGPFMTCAILPAAAKDQPAPKPAHPGDDLDLPSGRATLHIRVQCPNWLDINRVQVFVNGRMDPKLNFTRRTTPGRFGDQVVKFDQRIELLLNSDAHVIVAAAGEGLKLGPVMGPRWGQTTPIAVSNPIFCDVDGKGFKPNGDLLDVDLPIAP